MKSISKDEALENAIKTTLENPRHCLYFREPRDLRKIAKTLINANEIYELDISEKYEASINAHEHTHIISTNQTEFKQMIIFKSIDPTLKTTHFSFPMKVKHDKSLTDFHLIYASEIDPFLESFATIYQCKLQATPNDFKEQLLAQMYSSNPPLFALMVDIEEIFEKIMEKYVGKNEMFVRAIKKKIDGIYLHPAIFGMIMDLTFSTSNIVEERVFDRFRLIRDVESIPEWKEFDEIARYFVNYLHENNFSISSTSLGTPESIISSAMFLEQIKKISLTQEDLEPFIFGLLSEIDLQLGRITYVCDSLDSLEGKKIKKCYMGSISKDLLLASIKVTLGNLDEMIRNKKYEKHLNLLISFRENLSIIEKLKKTIFTKCSTEENCVGKTECVIKSKLCKAILEEILKT